MRRSWIRAVVASLSGTWNEHSSGDVELAGDVDLGGVGQPVEAGRAVGREQDGVDDVARLPPGDVTGRPRL
jgi:hypothetical protein